MIKPTLIYQLDVGLGRGRDGGSDLTGILGDDAS